MPTAATTATATTAIAMATSVLISGVFRLRFYLISSGEAAGPTVTKVDAPELPYESSPGNEATIS